MVHLRSNQRLFVSEDLLGYIDKLTSDGVIPYQVDFLQLGFCEAVQARLQPASSFSRHEITSDTNILGKRKIVIEAVAQWYAREIEIERPQDSSELLDFICKIGIAGGRKLRERWGDRRKGQIQADIATLTNIKE